MRKSQLLCRIIKNFLGDVGVNARFIFCVDYYSCLPSGSLALDLIDNKKNTRDNRVEIKNRKTGAVEYVSLDSSEIVAYFKNI
jgi:hypothetical protein